MTQDVGMHVFRKCLKADKGTSQMYRTSGNMNETSRRGENIVIRFKQDMSVEVVVKCFECFNNIISNRNGSFTPGLSDTSWESYVITGGYLRFNEVPAKLDQLTNTKPTIEHKEDHKAVSIGFINVIMIEEAGVDVGFETCNVAI